jgi:hypothetical protein
VLNRYYTPTEDANGSQQARFQVPNYGDGLVCVDPNNGRWSDTSTNSAINHQGHKTWRARMLAAVEVRKRTARHRLKIWDKDAVEIAQMGDGAHAMLRLDGSWGRIPGCIRTMLN